MNNPLAHNHCFNWKLSALALLSLVTACLPITTRAAEKNDPIKVMSFNIRYGAAQDGENSWPLRRDFLVETIQLSNPDLLGMQEVLHFQLEFVNRTLKDYGVYGVGRDDGDKKGEYAPILYRKSRFELLDSGTIWLSETPEIVGSKSWDAALHRILSWVLLKDKTNDSEFVYANTHWDHVGVEARLNSAKLMRQRYNESGSEYPVIVSGDFNTTEDNEPYQVLVNAKGTGGDKLIDTYRFIYPIRSPLEATFSRFTNHREGSRIDWILHSKQFTTLNALINHTVENGRNPSDHYPVEAVLRLK